MQNSAENDITDKSEENWKNGLTSAGFCGKIIKLSDESKGLQKSEKPASWRKLNSLKQFEENEVEWKVQKKF